MAISEAVRTAIVEYHHRGLSIREIAAETGVGKNTVSRVLSSDAVPKTVPKNDPSPARATGRLSPKNGDRMGTPPEPAEIPPGVPFVAPVALTQDLAVSELCTLLYDAKGTLAHAHRVNDGSPAALNAEVSAVKAVRDILRLIGEWCGLDDSVRTVDVNPTVTAGDVDGMDLETMRRMVREL